MGGIGGTVVEKKNGNGQIQGWVRTAIQIAAILGSLLWGVSEIKSDVRELDARVTGRINALSQHLDDLTAAADREHARFDQADQELKQEVRNLRYGGAR